MAKPWLAGVCCIAFSGSAGVVGADDLPLPELGSRVRVNSTALDSSPLVGTLSGVDQQSLTIVAEDGGARVVARQDVQRLERSVRPSRRSRGALIGFGVGLALSVGKAALQGGCNDGCNESNIMVAALVGLSCSAVGAMAAPGETWADVAVGPQQGRATMSLGAGLQVRLVPQLGRRIGLTVVASF
jgi:hypothetical protein